MASVIVGNAPLTGPTKAQFDLGKILTGPVESKQGRRVKKWWNSYQNVRRPECTNQHCRLYSRRTSLIDGLMIEGGFGLIPDLNKLWSAPTLFIHFLCFRSECEAQVKKFPGAKYKKFPTEFEAKDFINAGPSGELKYQPATLHVKVSSNKKMAIKQDICELVSIGDNQLRLVLAINLDRPEKISTRFDLHPPLEVRF